jgi:hypothetical protein
LKELGQITEKAFISSNENEQALIETIFFWTGLQDLQDGTGI